MRNQAFLFLIVLLMVSCGPAAKLRRAERLIKKAELLGATWTIDSVQVKVPVFLKEIRVDSIFKDRVGDTVVITKDRLTVKYVRIPGDSVFVEGFMPADTVYKTVTKTIQKVIYAPQKGLKWWHFILIGMGVMTVIFFIFRR